MNLTATLITLFYLCLFNFLIYRFRIFQLRHFRTWLTLLLFNLKFAVGIVIWLIYTFYYTDVQNNDIHKFYNDALVVHRAAVEDFPAFGRLMLGIDDERTQPYVAEMKNWQRNFDEAPVNENRTVIRLQALLLFFSFKAYFVHVLFMCFIALLGWVFLFNAVFAAEAPRNALPALLTLFLPSALFWTSGIMKEPLLLLGMGCFAAGLLHRRRWRSAALLLIGSTLILFSKFYVLVCLVPAAILYLLFKRQKQGLIVFTKYLIGYALFLLLAFNIRTVFPNIYPAQMLVNKYNSSTKEAAYFNAGSRISLPPISLEPLSIIRQIPHGIWNTIMRPYPWKGKNPMMAASALENLLVVLLTVLCLIYTDWKNLHRLNLLLFLAATALSYFALIGICTPVLGNLVRYRAPLLPLFLFLFFINVRVPLPQRLVRHFIAAV